MSRTGRPIKTNGSVYKQPKSQYWWVMYRDREGRRVRGSAGSTDRERAERFLRVRLQARDEGRLSAVLAGKNLTFDEWADWFLERRSKPPYRSEKTHRENLKALKLLRPVFGNLQLSEITPETIEDYIEQRLRSRRRVNTKFGVRHLGYLKPATVHQEFRVMRRILNVAVKRKRLAISPCQAVEFPVRVKDSIRKPHYMTLSEQERILFFAPRYLKNAVMILVEMGLRPYKELMPMQKSQVDLENHLGHVLDSKTPNGVADMPMTNLAYQAFQDQIEATPGSEYLFPTPRRGSRKPYLGSLKKIWASTLGRANVPYFSLYELRHTFATRLSAGGVADEWVTQLLRQGDAKVFKKYSQMKLQMMREALNRLNRRANEEPVTFDIAEPN